MRQTYLRNLVLLSLCGTLHIETYCDSQDGTGWSTDFLYHKAYDGVFDEIERMLDDGDDDNDALALGYRSQLDGSSYSIWEWSTNVETWYPK